MIYVSQNHTYKSAMSGTGLKTQYPIIMGPSWHSCGSVDELYDRQHSFANSQNHKIAISCFSLREKKEFLKSYGRTRHPSGKIKLIYNKDNVERNPLGHLSEDIYGSKKKLYLHLYVQHWS